MRVAVSHAVSDPFHRARPTRIPWSGGRRSLGVVLAGALHIIYNVRRRACVRRCCRARRRRRRDDIHTRVRKIHVLCAPCSTYAVTHTTSCSRTCVCPPYNVPSTNRTAGACAIAFAVTDHTTLLICTTEGYSVSPPYIITISGN